MPRSVIFVITAFDDIHIGKLPSHQVHAVIRKPFDVPQLVTMVCEVALMWHAETTTIVAELLLPLRSVSDENAPEDATQMIILRRDSSAPCAWSPASPESTHACSRCG